MLADSEYRHELGGRHRAVQGLLGSSSCRWGPARLQPLCRPSPVDPGTGDPGLMVLQWLVLMGLGFVIRLSPTSAGPSPWPWPRGEFAFRAVLVRRPEQGTAGQHHLTADSEPSPLHALTPLLLYPQRSGDPALVRLSQPERHPEHSSPNWWNTGHHRRLRSLRSDSGAPAPRPWYWHHHPGAGCQPDRDAEKVRLPGVYGDASRLDLLHAASAHKAKLLVLSSMTRPLPSW